MCAGHEPCVAERERLQLRQGVDDDGVDVEIQDALHIARQQERRDQPVVDLARIALRGREALEQLLLHGQERKVHPLAAEAADGRLIGLRQVGVEYIRLIAFIASVFQDGAHAGAEQRDKSPVDAEQEVHHAHPLRICMNCSPVIVSFS